MRMTTKALAGLALAMIAAQPALADPMPNPASKLSLSSAGQVRAAARTSRNSKFTTAGYVIAAVAVAAVVAGVIIIADDNKSKSP